MITQPYFQTIEQLSYAKKIPSEYIPACHLIYSSPATLSYNSPGAKNRRPGQGRRSKAGCGSDERNGLVPDV